MTENNSAPHADSDQPAETAADPIARLQEFAQSVADSAKKAIDDHVAAQQEWLTEHVAASEARFEKLKDESENKG